MSALTAWVPEQKPPPRNRRTRLILTEASPFTPDSLRSTLDKTLGENYKSIENARSEELAIILNFWHSHFYRAQEERRFNEIAKTALDACKTLSEVLPGIIEDVNKRFVASQDTGLVASWQIKHAQALVACLSPNGISFLQPYDLPNHANDWRWLIDVLPGDIERAIQPTNPHYKGGRSKTGPLSKILEVLIPSITGETVTAIAIGNQLILKANQGCPG